MKTCVALLSLAIALALSALISPSAAGDPGVGVTLGKIEVNERLKPGRRVTLPAVGVINTGSSRQDYAVVVSYRGGQQELKPSAKWFDIQPREFTLDAGQTQSVDLSLTVPSRAEPGEYFAFIEAQVDAPDKPVQVGVATKLTFTVAPGSWLDAQRTRLNRWLDDAAPWSYLVPVAVLGGFLVYWSSKRVRFRLPFEPR